MRTFIGYTLIGLGAILSIPAAGTFLLAGLCFHGNVERIGQKTARGY